MEKSNKTLIAGPWWGEFGHELFAWQAYVRSLSRFYEKTHIVCRKSSSYLYEDFADEFTFIDTEGGIPDGFLIHNFNMDECIYNLAIGELKPLLQGGAAFLPPRHIEDPYELDCKKEVEFGKKNLKPEYYSYGDKDEVDIEYVFHIRQRKLREEDNWSIENWKKLESFLECEKDKIACIGTISEAGYIEGTLDLRNKNLNVVCNALKNSKCIFGPSSGPIHLASLCECKQVVWSKPGNEKRYTDLWNPFNSDVLFLKEHSWQPSPEYVFEKFNNFIKV